MHNLQWRKVCNVSIIYRPAVHVCIEDATTNKLSVNTANARRALKVFCQVHIDDNFTYRLSTNNPIAIRHAPPPDKDRYSISLFRLQSLFIGNA